MYYESDEAKCKDYTNAIHSIANCQLLRNQLINQLITQINNYIQYPVKRILFFNRKQQASYEEVDFYEKFVGYQIYIPQVDKKEFYCIKSLLSSSSMNYIKPFGANIWIITNKYIDKYLVDKMFINDEKQSDNYEN